MGYLRQREPKGHNLVVRAKNWDSAESLVNLKSSHVAIENLKRLCKWLEHLRAQYNLRYRALR